MLKHYIKKVIVNKNLTRAEATDAMSIVMRGDATPAQIAAFITALRMKGETADEITGFSETMRSCAALITIDRTPATNIDKSDTDFLPGIVIDTCGTGGDEAHTFNISTISAFVVSGAGVTVAKHGNRSVSSSCGSADLLEALGVKIDLAPEKVKKVIERIGIGFMFAPIFHSAMKHAIGPRREIGIYTVFNILGPITNPASANTQVVGVYRPDLTETIATALKKMGIKSAMVIHGEGGLDEISITGPSKISRLSGGRIKTFHIHPEDFGMQTCLLRSLRGGDAERNSDIARDILEGRKGPARDVVVLNAAAALVTAGRTKDFKSGIALAISSIDSGAAARKLDLLRSETNK